MPRKPKEKIEVITTIPQAMPILALRNSAFFPHQIVPLSIGRESSIQAVEEALREEDCS